MADERDPQVSKRYRELGAEEPPRALDEAILAASRRAVDAHPAPLVVPTGRRRSYFPVAAAAIITLAVAVTVQVERQKPDDELVVATAPKEEQVAPEEKKQRAFKAPVEQTKPAPKPFVAQPPPAASAPQSADAMLDLAKSNEQAVAGQGARERQAPAETRASVLAEGRVAAQIQRKAETPEASLERIAELRRQGKHEEADKALAEFRKQYPDYRISDETRAKVERK